MHRCSYVLRDVPAPPGPTRTIATVAHRSRQAREVERAPLDAASAAVLATTLQALGTPSRLLILDRLRTGPSSVGELAEAVGMTQSAVSQQLRVLRNLGLVAGQREGRSVVYELHDDHVAALLDEALFHAEHVRGGLPRVVR